MPIQPLSERRLTANVFTTSFCSRKTPSPPLGREIGQTYRNRFREHFWGICSRTFTPATGLETTEEALERNINNALNIFCNIHSDLERYFFVHRDRSDP